MALIQCPECGAEASSKAQACPNCGYGIADHIKRMREEQEAQKRREAQRRRKEAEEAQKSEKRKRNLIIGGVVFFS